MLNQADTSSQNFDAGEGQSYLPQGDISFIVVPPQLQAVEEASNKVTTTNSMVDM